MHAGASVRITVQRLIANLFTGGPAARIAAAGGSAALVAVAAIVIESPQEFGIFSVAWASSSIVAVLISAGPAAVAMRDVARAVSSDGRESRIPVLLLSLRRSGYYGLAGITTLCSVLGVVSLLVDVSLRGIWLGLILALPLGLLNASKSALVASGFPSAGMLVGDGGTYAVIAALALPVPIAWDATQFCLALAALLTAAGVGALAACIRAGNPRSRDDQRVAGLTPPASERPIRSGAWARSASLAGLALTGRIVVGRLDIIVVGLMVGEEVAGTYSLFVNFAIVVTLVGTGLSVSATGALVGAYQSGFEQGEALRRSLATKGTASGLVLAAVVALAGFPTAEALLGRPPAVSGWILFILLFGPLTVLAMGPVGQILLLEGLYSQALRISVSVAVGFTVLVIVGSGLAGAVGAALANSASLIALNVWQLKVLQRSKQGTSA